MKAITWGLAAVVVFGLTGCAATAETSPSASELLIIPSTPEASVVSAAPPPVQPTPAAAVPPPAKGAEGGEPAIGSKVGTIVKSAITAAVVIDREHDKRIISENGDRPYHAGSLVKLLIAVDALQRHPNDQSVAGQVTRMIRLSDDKIASSFWVSEGGPSIVTRMARLMGLKQTKPPIPSTQWGETLVSANDLVRIYDYIMGQVADSDRQMIVRAMATMAPHGSDGFNQMYGIPLAAQEGLDWAVKQAWTNNDSTMSCHSTGLVGPNWRYTVIVLTENPRTTPWSSATAAVTAAAKDITTLLPTR
jgi:hypothetical protein